ncbi:MAG: 3-phosphoshikimate 1-carboxyvinyltransferase [Phycisphaerales bacterium]|nr:3-phosphoshikimate 1-carboxyvinyltransferase [Phycisphaerales bacterium]
MPFFVTNMSAIDTLRLPLAQLPDPLPIPVIDRPFAATIRPPGSKSLTNRALLLAALADGTSTLTSALVDADDALVMIQGLRALGAGITIDGTTITVRGVNGRWKPQTPNPVLNVRASGTAARFLTAAAALAPDNTTITIDGDARMRERPIGQLVDALRQIGATVEFVGREGSLPVRVHALKPTHPLGVTFGPTSSSQFISAMLMIGPFLSHELHVAATGPLTSDDYTWMTLALLRALGAPGNAGRDPYESVRLGLELDWRLNPARVRGFELAIEPDATGASYFQVAAAITPGAHITIPGLPAAQLGSLQGDVKFPLLVEEAGATFTGDPDRSIEIIGPRSLHAIDADLEHMPDTAMTAAVMLCFAAPTPDNPTATSTLRGLHTLRHKESDRLAALQTELAKLGATVEIITSPHDPRDVSLRLTPPPNLHALTAADPAARALPPITFDTYNDHRMAMSLALIGLRRPHVLIANPACVAKTYPTFWRDLASLFRSPAPPG